MEKEISTRESKPGFVYQRQHLSKAARSLATGALKWEVKLTLSLIVHRLEQQESTTVYRGTTIRSTVFLMLNLAIAAIV